MEILLDLWPCVLSGSSAICGHFSSLSWYSVLLGYHFLRDQGGWKDLPSWTLTWTAHSKCWLWLWFLFGEIYPVFSGATIVNSCPSLALYIGPERLWVVFTVTAHCVYHIWSTCSSDLILDLSLETFVPIRIPLWVCSSCFPIRYLVLWYDSLDFSVHPWVGMSEGWHLRWYPLSDGV